MHTLYTAGALAATLLLAPAALAAATPATPSDSDVLTIPPPGPPQVVGTSTVVRTDTGISASLEASQLPPGHVVTMWVVVANAPEECESGIPGLSPCGPKDHEEGRGQMSVHHGVGHVVDADGTESFGAHLAEGDTDSAFVDEPGLLDARSAEVILVLKDHGPKIQGRVADQLHTFGGGCQPEDLGELLVLDEDWAGEPGDYPCREIMFSPHVA